MALKQIWKRVRKRVVRMREGNGRNPVRNRLDQNKCRSSCAVIIFRKIQPLSKRMKIILNYNTPGSLRDDGLQNVAFRFFTLFILFRTN